MTTERSLLGRFFFGGTRAGPSARRRYSATSSTA